MDANASQRRPIWPFVVALIFPLIGFVLGVIEAAKRSPARGTALMVVSLVNIAVWYAVYAQPA